MVCYLFVCVCVCVCGWCIMSLGRFALNSNQCETMLNKYFFLPQSGCCSLYRPHVGAVVLHEAANYVISNIKSL